MVCLRVLTAFWLGAKVSIWDSLREKVTVVAFIEELSKEEKESSKKQLRIGEIYDNSTKCYLYAGSYVARIR